MGMFDTISVSDQLPFTDEMKELGLDARNYSLQTKDLDNVMAEYVLQENKLYITKYKISEWVDGDPKAKNMFDRIGYLKREEPYLEEVKHHGVIYGCEYRTNVDNKWDCWIEFELKFTDGLLTESSVHKFDKVDATERIQRQDKFMREIKERNSRFINKYFFHTTAYRWFGGKIRRVLSAAANALQTIAYKI